MILEVLAGTYRPSMIEWSAVRAVLAQDTRESKRERE
jgi:hypothetical protein